MKIVIVGSGRVGSSAAELWDRAGHEVVILDVSTHAFDRLPATFGGNRGHFKSLLFELARHRVFHSQAILAHSQHGNARFEHSFAQHGHSHGANLAATWPGDDHFGFQRPVGYVGFVERFEIGVVRFHR